MSLSPLFFWEAIMKINILGTPYRVRRVKNGQDEFMDKMHYGGYCDGGSHEIVV